MYKCLIATVSPCPLFWLRALSLVHRTWLFMFSHRNHTRTHTHTQFGKWKSIMPCTCQVAWGRQSNLHTPSPPSSPLLLFFSLLLYNQFASTQAPTSPPDDTKRQKAISTLSLVPSLHSSFHLHPPRNDLFIFSWFSLFAPSGWEWRCEAVTTIQ